MNLMVIDDDEDLREILAELLVECGHHVTMAGDGEAALLALAAADTLPDLIILDWMMPRMDGLRFRRRQRDDPRLAVVPVVLMTATTAIRVPLDQIDPDAMLHKPIALAELLRVVERLGAQR